MITRIGFITMAAAVGIGIGSLVPGVSQTIRHLVSPLPLLGSLASRAQEPATGKGATKGHDHGPGDHAEDGTIEITAEGIAAAKIEVAPVAKGTLSLRLRVPGTITPDTNRIARVAAKVVGTVSELKKQLGDMVAKGEVVAALDSREVADAKSEYVSAQVNFELQRTLYEREQSLAQAKIIAENQFLRTRNAFTEVQLRVALARQKLLALNLGDSEIAALSRDSTALQRYELRSPIAGRIVERLVDLGAPVGGEGQAKEIYVIADLSSVWVELAVPAADLPAIKEGQPVVITGSASKSPTEGKIVFISPMLTQDTRSARVIASVGNADFTWRPGSYVTAEVTTQEIPAEIVVPRSALQTIKGEQIVFVRTAKGFEKREVVLGRSDDRLAEVVFGLDPGESIAIANTFVLKAELGKAEAEHQH